jgi:hypothetical protein
MYGCREASLPFAGITRIRFNGYDLSPIGRAPLMRFSGAKVWLADLNSYQELEKVIFD